MLIGPIQVFVFMQVKIAKLIKLIIYTHWLLCSSNLPLTGLQTQHFGKMRNILDAIDSLSELKGEYNGFKTEVTFTRKFKATGFDGPRL